MTGLLSYGIAALSFSTLATLLILSRQRVSQGKVLVFACVCTSLWAIVGIKASIGTPGLLFTSGLTDSLRILSWGLFIHSILATDHSNLCVSDSANDSTRVSPLNSLRRLARFPVLMAIQLGVLTVAYAGLVSETIPASVAQTLIPTLWITAALCGLVLLERLYFSASHARKAALKTLCIGLGGMFTLDFFVFTDALLFRRINLDLWQVRGFFYGLLTPFIALAIARNPDWSLQLHVSRQAVTSSVTMLAAGAYLTATAVAAYFIRVSGMEWASVAQMALILLALLVLVVMLLSKRLRASTRVYISKHFFNFKYDYRTEWLKFTEMLAKNPQNAGTSILQAMIGIVDSDSGVLWAKDRDGQFERIACNGFGEAEFADPSCLTPIAEFMGQSGWVIEIDEYKNNPDHYQHLKLPDVLINHPLAWLLVPLPSHESLAGVVLIARSPIVKSINWEDRDLLKTAGRQASTLLVQMRIADALTEARQFEAFSKMSAYIVHDLKNIMSQQSLIVSNARKHKHKPEFVDDVISTIDNSVNRMQSLLEQLRDQQSLPQREAVELRQILKSAIQQRSKVLPVPELVDTSCTATIQADSDILVRAFAHLIHNAQDATPKEGTITLSVERQSDTVIVRVADTGKGMSQTFIRDRLFKPFASTKGLTGMGIGAYESREYIRSIGGTLDVNSLEARGTVFTITIPLLSELPAQSSRTKPDAQFNGPTHA